MGVVMFCTECGAQMPEGARFCTVCGAKMVEEDDIAGTPVPVTPADAAVGATPTPSAAAPDPQAAGVPERPQKRSRAPLIAAVVAGVAVLGVGIAAIATSGFGLLGFGGQQAGQTSVRAVDRTATSGDAALNTTVTPADTGQDTDAAGEGMTGADAATSGAASSSPEPRRAPSTISPDLSSQSDREVINTFVTNFSEVNEGLSARSHFTREDASDPATLAEMIVFLERHMSGNQNAHIETVGADDPFAADGYQFRCDADYFCGLVYKYFGVNVTPDQLGYEHSSGGRGTVSDGWFYYGFGSDAWFASQGVANVTSLVDTGGNLFDVTFDVYRPSGNVAPAEIKLRVYGWPLADMLDAVGASDTPIYSGTATLEAYYDEGELAFHLYRMN